MVPETAARAACAEATALWTQASRAAEKSRPHCWLHRVMPFTTAATERRAKEEGTGASRTQIASCSWPSRAAFCEARSRFPGLGVRRFGSFGVCSAGEGIGGGDRELCRVLLY